MPLSRSHAAPHPIEEDLLQKAAELLELFCAETGEARGLARRLAEVEAQIRETGTYEHTFAELEHGARVAWRNSVRCVGRLHWPSLTLFDCRAATTFDEVRDRLLCYLDQATNGGKIQATIAVFEPQRPGLPGPRIWNEQLIRYAGYRQADGTVLGDPRQVEITAEIEKLGWCPSRRTAFDILPVVVELPGEKPRWFELPRGGVLEVPLEHPEEPGFRGLGLKWHAVPAISSMRLEIGGLDYTMAPFNGWYMGAEIGARNLSDEDRYDCLPAIADLFGLDRRKERSLWRDRALVELNVAVLYSYEKAGVRIVDHHTASQHFLKFEAGEASQGRPTYAEWSWVVPPVSGSTSPLFHHPFESREATPNFFYQPAPWHRDGNPAKPTKCPFHKLPERG